MSDLGEDTFVAFNDAAILGELDHAIVADMLLLYYAEDGTDSEECDESVSTDTPPSYEDDDVVLTDVVPLYDEEGSIVGMYSCVVGSKGDARGDDESCEQCEYRKFSKDVKTR